MKVVEHFFPCLNQQAYTCSLEAERYHWTNAVLQFYINQDSLNGVQNPTKEVP